MLAERTVALESRENALDRLTVAVCSPPLLGLLVDLDSQRAVALQVVERERGKIGPLVLTESFALPSSTESGSDLGVF